MWQRHKIAEKGFIQALDGKDITVNLPLGPNPITPSFTSSPNWTLLSWAAKYIEDGGSRSAVGYLTTRLNGELNGSLGFMLQEPHSRNYSRMHYAAYKAVNFYAAQRGETELYNLTLIWLHHFFLIRSMGTLTDGSIRDVFGGRKMVIGYTDNLAGMRSTEKWAGGTACEMILSDAIGHGQIHKRKAQRNQAAWCWREVRHLGIGDELSKPQKKDLLRVSRSGRLPETFSKYVYDVGVRTPLNILRTTEGVATWFDHRIADKTAVIAMSQTRGERPSYLMGNEAESVNNSQAIVNEKQETIRMPRGRKLWRMTQNMQGMSIHEYTGS